MRRRLWLVPGVLLGVAVLGCPTDADVARVQANVTKVDHDLKIWADSMTEYLKSAHDAICKLAQKPPTTTLPDQTRFKCVPGSGEGNPPPKYPPG